MKLNTNSELFNRNTAEIDYYNWKHLSSGSLSNFNGMVWNTLVSSIDHKVDTFIYKKKKLANPPTTETHHDFKLKFCVL